MLQPILSPKLFDWTVNLYKKEAALSPNKGRLAALPVTIAVSLLHISTPVVSAIEYIALTTLHMLGALLFKNCSLGEALRCLNLSIHHLIIIPFALVMQPILMIRNFYALLLDPAFLNNNSETLKKDSRKSLFPMFLQRKKLYKEKKASNASFQADFIDATHMSFMGINNARFFLNDALKNIQAVFSSKTRLSERPIHLMSFVNKAITSLSLTVGSVASLILAPLNLAHNLITKKAGFKD